MVWCIAVGFYNRGESSPFGLYGKDNYYTIARTYTAIFKTTDSTAYELYIKNQWGTTRNIIKVIYNTETGDLHPLGHSNFRQYIIDYIES